MKVLTEERKAIILAKVEEKGSITVSELVEELNTSESTVRRDLIQLDHEGRLMKVHGGAVRISPDIMLNEPNVSDKEKRFSNEKSKIAKYAASLISKGDFVFLDAGTTTKRMLKYITEKEATYVTNSFTHANVLSKMGFKVLLTGGEVKASTEAIIGVECIETLKKFNFTKCFVGTNGISVEQGFTTHTTDEASVKRCVLERSFEKYILADHSKFNKIAAITFFDLSNTCIITDFVGNDKYKKLTKIEEVDK